MPRKGFRSITVSDYIYERFSEVYAANRDDLATRGVRSMSGYVSYMLQEAMNRDKTFAANRPRITMLAIEDERAVLQDNELNRIVEVVKKKKDLYCYMCSTDNCVHIGYVFSHHAAYGTLIPDMEDDAS